MTVIWSGVTEEGAVVPVQVDGAGRVVATTGEPPGPPVIEYNGASAWAKVAADGTIDNGLNVASATRSAIGTYNVVFVTPMPDDNYSVVGAANDKSVYSLFSVGELTATGFDVYISNESTPYYDNPFAFAVFSSNALPPMGGTGTDSWASVDSSGNLLASFNVASVTKVDTGQYEVVFTTPMPTDEYSIQLTPDNRARFRVIGYESVTSGGFQVNTADDGGNKDNSPFSFSVNATNAVLPVTVTAEQLYAVTNNWYLEGEESILTTRYKVDMQEGIVFAGGKAGITRDGELYFTSNGGKYVIAVNDEQIGLTRIDSAY